ncbi:hypothetical protein BpHYR1_012978 [Brachionus plicatilis]|uniref:Uncharacterized protein n=1 Tax=Brachionus plicatilis TaxID=10195 RepID=A0A3M7P919_BRAPC|nr:hypothetical protein BpHYR1_012978 [Brachionus plicatilis]
MDMDKIKESQLKTQQVFENIQQIFQTLVESEADMITLQANLDAVAEWCWTWLMEANESKIKIMNIEYLFFAF